MLTRLMAKCTTQSNQQVDFEVLWNREPKLCGLNTKVLQEIKLVQLEITADHQSYRVKIKYHSDQKFNKLLMKKNIKGDCTTGHNLLQSECKATQGT